MLSPHTIDRLTYMTVAAVISACIFSIFSFSGVLTISHEGGPTEASNIFYAIWWLSLPVITCLLFLWGLTIRANTRYPVLFVGLRGSYYVFAALSVAAGALVCCMQMYFLLRCLVWEMLDDCADWILLDLCFLCVSLLILIGVCAVFAFGTRVFVIEGKRTYKEVSPTDSSAHRYDNPAVTSNGGETDYYA